MASSKMIHNHPCDKQYLTNDVCFRKLSDDQLQVVIPMVTTGSDPEQNIKYVEENFGKTITVHYVNNSKTKFSNIVGVSAMCINVYKCFLEVICINSIHNNNRGNYKLFHSIAAENCGHGTPVISAWTKEGKKGDMVWVISQFKLTMGNTSNTKMFVIDYARSVISAVGTTYHTAHIVLCSFHVRRPMCWSVLKRCRLLTWGARGDLGQDVLALLFLDCTEGNRLNPLYRTRINTVTGLLEVMTAEDTRGMTINLVDEVIRNRLLP
ncbi:hypothetical protein Smp_175400 [Schistosoma mansoni]|uniref:MULE domain-containing protein n=1 Tax=Schistosoma mansoni TaxID=6183 RepID=G4VBM1_SCHMA|nr:hypothetical protein Smp_175400 [Schistosoma mansoni]|eukprot:XP_018649919.1 hypothetical protein Smp_175400 [Schistosoma mansoni]